MKKKSSPHGKHQRMWAIVNKETGDCVRVYFTRDQAWEALREGIMARNGAHIAQVWKTKAVTVIH